MYEAWAEIYDASVAPDARGDWPSLAAIHVVSDKPFDIDVVHFSRFYRTELGRFARLSYFNDCDTPPYDWPRTCVELAYADVTEFPDVGAMWLMREITEAVYGTYVAFETLPIIPVVHPDAEDS